LLTVIWPVPPPLHHRNLLQLLVLVRIVRTQLCQLSPQRGQRGVDHHVAKNDALRVERGNCCRDL
jgi:hypothetical protein